ncbi:MAG: hypothetical protein EOO69_04470 [Moraxellaceae bacterium]|nr:MAG: hypothetical protein EOO69_04470 [Moraxellaceae bacterium]
MQSIPLQVLPSQVVSVVLAKQNCQITIYQKTTGLYFDLVVNGNPVVNTRLIRNAVPLVRYKHLGLLGDFMVMDMQGLSDPEYSGLGSRYQLTYIEAYEL